MLKLKNISLSFEEDIIKEGDIDIYDQHITVIAGKSGSGKSSLLYDMALISEQAQMIYEIDGVVVNHWNDLQKKNFQRHYFSFVFQNIQLIDCMTLLENIQFFSYFNASTFSEDQARRYLDDFDLMLDDQTKIQTLSGGEKQRLAIICALMKNTPVMIFDEPTAYLDDNNKQRFVDLLIKLRDEYHKTIVIATHDQYLIDHCDSLYEIKDQQIIYCHGKPKQSQAIENNMRFQCQKALQFFYQKNKASERWRRHLLQCFLIMMFTVVSFSMIFLQVYQKEMDDMIQNMQSSQIVVDTQLPIKNQTLNKVKSLDNIKDAKRITPIITDEDIVLCPYMDASYFTYYIKDQRVGTRGYYANQNAFRHHKEEVVTVTIQGQTFDLPIQFSLRQIFEDYQGYIPFSKVIYVPYDKYKEIQSRSNQEQQPSTLVLLELYDQSQYIKTLQDINREYESFTIIGVENFNGMLRIQDQLSMFSQTVVLFVFGLFVLAMIILKIYEQYQWRISTAFIEANGVYKKDIFRLFMKKEVMQILFPAIISSIIVSGLYLGFQLLNMNIFGLIIIIILVMASVIILLSLLIERVVWRGMKTIHIIKRF